MKRLTFWLFLITVIVVTADILLGAALKHYMKKKTLPGDYEMVEHLLRNLDEDVIVLGSSVALNGINTQRLSDSLHIEAYNGGANGQTMPYFLTALKGVVAQKKPRMVILGLSPNNLCDTGLGTRYNLLAPYYGMGIADIDSCLMQKDAIQPFLLKSNLCRLNTIWFRIGLYFFAYHGTKCERGHVAKPVPTMFPTLEKHSGKQISMSQERERQFDEFVEICKSNQIPLVVLLAPHYTEKFPHAAYSVYGKLKSKSIKKGFVYYDDTNLYPFDTDSTLYYDQAHIHGQGALIYTDTLIKRLRPLLQ